MAANDDQFWDIIKILIGAGVSSFTLIVTGLWRGWFSGLKERYQKEVEHVKEEAAVEQLNKLNNQLLASAVAKIEELVKHNTEIQNKFGEVTEKLHEISEKVAVQGNDIGNLKDTVKEIKNKSNGFQRSADSYIDKDRMDERRESYNKERRDRR